MSKKYSLSILMLLASLFICSIDSVVMAKVYIDIDAPGFQQFPIAVSDFQIKNPQPGKSSDFNIAIADNVRNYLNMSGIFKILDKKRCYKECLRNAEKYGAIGTADVCGKCVANTPCSFTNPSGDNRLKKLRNGRI